MGWPVTIGAHAARVVVVVVEVEVVVVGLVVVVVLEVEDVVVVVGGRVVVVEVVVVVTTGAVVVVVAAGAVVVVVTTGAVVVVVAAGAVVVVVAAGAVVVVVEPTHEPPAPHASQQLGTDPTHTVPPRGALQFPRCLIEQVVWPVAFWQQVTKPGLPQVDCAAHRTTAPLHWDRSDPFSTATSVTSSTQFT